MTAERRWTHSSAGLTYGDEAEPIKTVWSLSATPDGALLAGVEPAGLFRSEDGGSTVAPHRGPDQPPDAPDLGTGRRRADPAHDHPPPDRHRPDVGRDLRGRRLRDARRRHVVGAAQRRRPRGVQSREPVPGDRPVRPQVRDRRGRARDAVPAEPLRRLPLRRRVRDVAGDHRRPARRTSASRWSSTRATPTRAGSSRSASPRRAATCPTATPRSGEPTTGARRGSVRTPGCRRATRTCRSCARRWPATRSTRSGSRSGPKPGSCGTAPTRASSWRMITDTLPEIWAVEAVVLED